MYQNMGLTALIFRLNDYLENILKSTAFHGDDQVKM